MYLTYFITLGYITIWSLLLISDCPFETDSSGNKLFEYHSKRDAIYVNQCTDGKFQCEIGIMTRKKEFAVCKEAGPFPLRTTAQEARKDCMNAPKYIVLCDKDGDIIICKIAGSTSG